MNKTVKTAINTQANYELYASLSYQAISFWCEANDYSGFASFFQKQQEEEREHAKLFFDHLLSRGIQPELSAIEETQNQFQSIQEVALKAQTLERHNSEKIKLCYEMALESKDYESMPMLLRFIEEQVEEEAWTDKMVTLTKRAECPGALLNLDRHISKELGEA